MPNLRGLSRVDDPQSYQKVFPSDFSVRMFKFVVGANEAQPFSLPREFKYWRGLRTLVWNTIQHGTTNGKRTPRLMTILGNRGLLNDNQPVVALSVVRFGPGRNGHARFRAEVIIDNLGFFLVQHDFDGMTVEEMELLLQFD